jgi:dipeptidyl aminopeptidase/acylaminoacyl peptidase
MKNRLRNLLKIGFAALMAAAFVSAPAVETKAQRLNLERVVEALEKNGCVTVGAGKIKICKYDYKFEDKAVEAIMIRPAIGDKFPSLLLAPGFDRSAKDLIPYGVMFAHEGFASLAVTPPGFGESEGKADFVGPQTQKVFIEGWRRFKAEPFVDDERMGIFGHSRGGMAASLLALRLTDAKAAVLASGVYDFERAFRDIPVNGIREKMMEETGMTEEAAKQRSAALQMEKLKIPLLILHGEKDEKVPVSQAYLLRDRLAELKKDFEVRIFPGAGHVLDEKEVIRLAADFFRRRMGVAAKAQK